MTVAPRSDTRGFPTLQWMRAIRDDSRVSHNGRTVAWALASRFNSDEGFCYPGLRRIATDCGWSKESRKTVSRALDELEGFGYLDRERSMSFREPSSYAGRFPGASEGVHRPP